MGPAVLGKKSLCGTKGNGMNKIIAMCTPQIIDFFVIALGLKERGIGVPTYNLQSYGKNIYYLLFG